MNEKTSTVCLVDLAGSERSSVSQTTGDRLKEGSSINKSLTTLGLVIKALADKSRLEQQGRLEESRRIFVPYRDSILTWLLKECLGGNSKTIMLATVNPSARFAEETMSTLRYANRARNIINRIQVNEDPNIRIIKELREEIRRLKDRLAVYEGANGDAGRERVESGAVSVTSGDVARLEALLQESTKLANLSWEQRHANFTSDDGELDDDYDEPEVAAFDDDEPEVAAFDDVEPLFSAPSASRQQPQSNATPVMETNSRSQLSSSIEWSKQQDINTTTRFSLVRLPDGQQQLTPTAPISTQQLEQFEIEPGETKIGSDPLSQNIVLDGLYIESRHALLDTDPSGNLFITPVGRCSDTDGLNDILLQHCRRQSSQLQSVANKFEAAVKINSADELPWIYVNGERIMDRTQLFIGSRVMFSRSNVFQVVDAQQLRDKQQQSAIQSDDVSAVDGLPEMSRPPAADANGEGEDEDSNMLPIKTTRLLMPTPPSSAGSNRRTLFDERTLSAAGPQQPIQIPYYEQVVDDLGRSFYTFHIYLTLPSSSNSSSTCTYHVSRRFREFNAFYRQWKPYMPLLIDRSFPSQWSTLFSGSSRNAQLRRHRLELFLNSFLLWWIQKASAQYRRPVDVDLIQRKLWLFSDLNALGPSPSSSSSLAPTAVSEREPRKSLPNSKSRTETSSASSADVFSRIR
jgi:hypothetical protein